MKEKIENSIEFVARYWRPNAFRAKGLPGASVSSSFRRWSIAATVAGVVALSAVAAIYFDIIPTSAPEQAQAPVEQTLPAVDARGVARIEFTDMPLSRAVAQIEKIYGVTIVGKESIPEGRNVSLSWEGTVEELVETLNSMFNTELKVER